MLLLRSHTVCYLLLFGTFRLTATNQIEHEQLFIGSDLCIENFYNFLVEAFFLQQF